MTIEYKTEEKDLLTHHLFIATKSELIKKRRLRSKIFVPLIYIVFGLLFLLDDKDLMTIIFFMIGILWFLIYPIWEKRHFINYYKKLNREKYKDRIGRTVSLEFSNEFILAKDDGSESKLLTTELEEICEIPSFVFLMLKGGQSIALPKDRITEFDKLKTRLKELADHLKIKYNNDENWEWK